MLVRGLRRGTVLQRHAVVLTLLAFTGTLYATPFERPFFEGDDSISFPVVAHETVPFHMLLVYAILIPALCVIAIPLIVRWHIGFSETIRPVVSARDAAPGVTVLIACADCVPDGCCARGGWISDDWRPHRFLYYLHQAVCR